MFVSTVLGVLLHMLMCVMYGDAVVWCGVAGVVIGGVADCCVVVDVDVGIVYMYYVCCCCYCWYCCWC